ncbi:MULTISPECIES: hypothetical protein [unclassified Bartonella]|uniref:hypothetical protein n=1 Tax=unclassified Bartonella TaxID=2645622 RepID=UPI00099A52B3|nr:MULTISPECIES: hypothetical protein [unclassified Bartonella]AQX28021.1 hypothetical protein BJB15x_006170 [Bartonella sp. JB15]AQX29297.1 hypothetical protein BJB63x_006110 [Bartonella sp. JB63]
MKLNIFLRSIILFIMIVCISPMVIAVPIEVYYDPYCQTSKYIFFQKTIKAGKNSFTASQIKNHLMENGFQNIKRLRLDDKGIWRALVELKKRYFLISVDYSGTISIQNERKKYD